ncbi:MAG TPA: hypothetical protein P5248_10995, partial [Bacteroidales bacterium]|nr:hypothetical protein [Bacteroidales bacterium]
TEESDVIKVTAVDVEFAGFTVDAQHYDPAGNFQAWGIVSTADGSEIRNNRVLNSETGNILISSWYWDGDSWETEFRSGAVIEYNYIANTDIFSRPTVYGYGLYIQGAYGDVLNNVVEDCRSAIQVQPYNHPNTSGVTGKVEGNSFEGYSKVVYYNYSQNPASDWLFDNNIVTGIAPPSGVTIENWNGITIQTYTGGTVAFTDNVIGVGTASATNTHGFMFAQGSGASASALLTGNQVTGMDYGIRIESGIAYVSNIHIEDNSIAGNAHGVLNGTTTALDASPNWWGDPTGPYHSTNPCGQGNDVSDYVTYSPWYYQSDMTTVNGLPQIVTSPVPDISTITYTPVIISLSVTYPGDLENYDPAVLTDALITSDLAFPATAEVISVKYNGSETLGAVYSLSGKTQAYLSEILGSSAYPLANHDGLVTTWDLTLAGVEDPATYGISFSPVSYLGSITACNNILGTDEFSLSFDDAVQTVTGTTTTVCYTDPLEFSVSITYPVLANVNTDIKADCRISSDVAFEAGTAIAWEYNSGAATGSFTLSSPLSVIMLSDI